MAQAPASTTTASVRSESSLPPTDLVFLALQGRLRSQGIPSAAALIEAHHEGRVSSRMIVEAAVKANRLSAETLNDPTYLRLIDATFSTLKSNSR
ncbi:hypothetical protein H6F43_18215 [Leptolyngbya sp. FACHB-36]|nr:hypothetical protein [Leptolyngbya sp. FACHB-36]